MLRKHLHTPTPSLIADPPTSPLLNPSRVSTTRKDEHRSTLASPSNRTCRRMSILANENPHGGHRRWRRSTLARGPWSLSSPRRGCEIGCGGVINAGFRVADTSTRGASVLLVREEWRCLGHIGNEANGNSELHFAGATIVDSSLVGMS